MNVEPINDVKCNLLAARLILLPAIHRVTTWYTVLIHCNKQKHEIMPPQRICINPNPKLREAAMYL